MIKRHILRKGIVFSAILVGLSFLNFAHAAEENIKLKKSCIRDYPQVSGQTDPELLGIYSQVCDKKNADSKNDLLAQAAMRFHQLGQNMNALYLANYLKQQNVRGNLLTDVIFLSSVSIANSSLKEMRNNEMRYLSEDVTYPPAKEFVDAIKTSVPAPTTNSNLKAITDESIKSQARSSRSNTVSSNTKRTTKTTTKPRSTTPAATPKPTASANKSNTNPFESLK